MGQCHKCRKPAVVRVHVNGADVFWCGACIQALAVKEGQCRR